MHAGSCPVLWAVETGAHGRPLSTRPLSGPGRAPPPAGHPGIGWPQQSVPSAPPQPQRSHGHRLRTVARPCRPRPKPELQPHTGTCAHLRRFAEGPFWGRTDKQPSPKGSIFPQDAAIRESQLGNQSPTLRGLLAAVPPPVSGPGLGRAQSAGGGEAASPSRPPAASPVPRPGALVQRDQGRSTDQ